MAGEEHEKKVMERVTQSGAGWRAAQLAADRMEEYSMGIGAALAQRPRGGSACSRQQMAEWQLACRNACSAAMHRGLQHRNVCTQAACSRAQTACSCAASHEVSAGRCNATNQAA